MSLIKQINTSITNHETLVDFCAKHPAIALLEDAAFCAHEYTPVPTITTYDAAAIGAILGTDGWTAEPRSDTRRKAICFDWSKIIDGVNIIIMEAQKIAFEEKPVQPKDFPLELQDMVIKTDIPF